VRALLGRIALLELAPTVLRRALEPFPSPVRTLDALHLASFDFLRTHVHDLQLATYDDGMLTVARRMQIPIFDLG
jgi:hypothetical protein